MSSLLEKIIEWASTLPTWEQSAFSLVLQRRNATDEEVADLLTMLLESKGLRSPTVHTEWGQA